MENHTQVHSQFQLLTVIFKMVYLLLWETKKRQVSSLWSYSPEHSFSNHTGGRAFFTSNVAMSKAGSMHNAKMRHTDVQV